jgi:hypothetical protein
MMIPDSDEIAQIERELEILRSRQASLARSYRVTMIFLAITCPVIAALIAAIIYWNFVAIIHALSSDIVMVAFIFGMTAIVAGLIWIIGRPWSVPPDQQKPSQFLPLGGMPGWGFGYKSDADTIQEMIVLRKRRLAELTGEPPPSVPSVSR